MGLSLELGRNESVWIGEAQVVIEKIGDNKVRVNIIAPRSIPIVRDELKRREVARQEADRAQP